VVSRVSRIRNSAAFYQPAREVLRVPSIGSVDTRWTTPSSLHGGTQMNGLICSFSSPLPDKVLNVSLVVSAVHMEGGFAPPYNKFPPL
jgi:hypothetical protein